MLPLVVELRDECSGRASELAFEACETMCRTGAGGALERLGERFEHQRARRREVARPVLLVDGERLARLAPHPQGHPAGGQQGLPRRGCGVRTAATIIAPRTSATRPSATRATMRTMRRIRSKRRRTGAARARREGPGGGRSIAGPGVPVELGSVMVLVERHTLERDGAGQAARVPPSTRAGAIPWQRPRQGFRSDWRNGACRGQRPAPFPGEEATSAEFNGSSEVPGGTPTHRNRRQPERIVGQAMGYPGNKAQRRRWPFAVRLR